MRSDPSKIFAKHKLEFRAEYVQRIWDVTKIFFLEKSWDEYSLFVIFMAFDIGQIEAVTSFDNDLFLYDIVVHT